MGYPKRTLIVKFENRHPEPAEQKEQKNFFSPITPAEQKIKKPLITFKISYVALLK